MKLLLEPIEVKISNGLPVALRWRGRVYHVVNIAAHWLYRGKWWTDVSLHGEVRRYYRVFCERARFEIFELTTAAPPARPAADIHAAPGGPGAQRPGLANTCSTPDEVRLTGGSQLNRWVLSRVLD